MVQLKIMKISNTLFFLHSTTSISMEDIEDFN